MIQNAEKRNELNKLSNMITSVGEDIELQNASMSSYWDLIEMKNNIFLTTAKLTENDLKEAMAEKLKEKLKIS